MKIVPVSQLDGFIMFFSFWLILQRAAGAFKETEERLMFPEGQKATDLRGVALLSFAGTFSKTGKYSTEQFIDIPWSNGGVICVDPRVYMSFRSFMYTGALVLGFLVLFCFV